PSKSSRSPRAAATPLQVGRRRQKRAPSRTPRSPAPCRSPPSAPRLAAVAATGVEEVVAAAVGVAAGATEFAEPHVAQLLRAKRFRQPSDKGSVTALRQRQRRSGWSLSASGD